MCVGVRGVVDQSVVDQGVAVRVKGGVRVGWVQGGCRVGVQGGGAGGECRRGCRGGVYGVCMWGKGGRGYLTRLDLSDGARSVLSDRVRVLQGGGGVGGCVGWLNWGHG